MEDLAEDGRGGVARARADATPPATSRLTLRPGRNRRVTKSEPARRVDVRAIADACGRALRRSLTTIVALIVVSAIGGTAWAGYRFVLTSSRFAVTTIAIPGAQRLDVDELRAALPVHAGDNVFAASLDDVVAQLRANPWIEAADARRVLPHAIVIELRERSAAAVVELDDRYLADANGRAFKRAAAGEGDGLPLVTGIARARYLADPDAAARTVQNALGVLATWRQSAERPAIVELRVDPRGTLVLVTAAGVTIELGRVDATLPARLAAFDAAWTSLGDDARARAVQIRVRTDRATVAFASH